MVEAGKEGRDPVWQREIKSPKKVDRVRVKKGHEKQA